MKFLLKVSILLWYNVPVGAFSSFLGRTKVLNERSTIFLKTSGVRLGRLPPEVFKLLLWINIYALQKKLKS